MLSKIAVYCCYLLPIYHINVNPTGVCISSVNSTSYYTSDALNIYHTLYCFIIGMDMSDFKNE